MSQIEHDADQDSAHSRYSPSSSAGWANCADYLNANAGLPDTAGKDAAHGTVFHSFVEEWLRSGVLPSHRVGKTETAEAGGVVYEFEIDVELVDYARECIEWVRDIPGDRFIEQRVDFSDLTPIPGQKGTCDLGIAQPRRLTIRDWKFGKGVLVSITDHLYDPNDPIEVRVQHLNSQVMIYGYGFFREWDWLYDFQEIDIGIGQPRLENWDSIVISRAEMLAFAAWIKERAAETVKPNPPRTPSTKACRWCKVKDCSAQMAQNLRLVEGRFGDLDAPVQQVEMEEVTSKMIAEPMAPDPAKMTTGDLVRALSYRKMMETFFAKVEQELEWRALQGEVIPTKKLVTGRKQREWLLPEEALEDALRKLGLRFAEIWNIAIRSPSQIEELLKANLSISIREAKELVKPFVVKPEGRPTLVDLSDKRPAIDPSLASRFGAVEDDI